MAAQRFSFLTLTAAIVSGLGLWLYVSLTRTYEDDVVVPFTVISPPNQALLSTVPANLTVRVRASGLQLLNVRYFTKSVACTLDLRRLRPTGPSTFLAEQPDLLRSIVSATPLRMLSVAPGQLSLTTGDLAVKLVPLRIVHVISCRPGFVVTAAPSSDQHLVEVRGTRSIVERLQEWHTQLLSLEDVHESITIDLPVHDSLVSLVNVAPSTVRVHVEVQQSADVTIADVPLTLATSTGSAAIHLSQKYLRVRVRGGVESVAGLTAKDFRAEITERPSSGYARPHVIAPTNVEVLGTEPVFVRVRSRE